MFAGSQHLAGRVLGGYRLERLLGTSAAGAIYQGRVVATPQVVVTINVGSMPTDAQARAQHQERFRREAQTLQRLRHPHIIPLLDVGEAEGFTYLVLPSLTSGTLADLLQRQHRLALTDVGGYLTRLASALDYAHSQWVVHRDLKPGSVLLDAQGQPYLSDFQMARFTTPTGPSQVVGTPASQAPELADAGQVGPAADIYSLGVMAYELVTGQAPFQAISSPEVLKQHAQEPSPPPRGLRPDLPAAAEAVILQALAQRPEERFQSAGAFAQAFALGLQGLWAPGVRRPAEEPAPVVTPHTVQAPPGPPTTPGRGAGVPPHLISVGAPRPGNLSPPQPPVEGSVPPVAPRPGAPPRRSRVGLIALVVALLLVVLAGGGAAVLGANHQGPLSGVFPSGSTPTRAVAATGTPQPSPTPSIILPAGTITEFPLPTPGSYPEGITTDPDGNLWFMEPQTNQIARVTPAGTITEFPLPTPNSGTNSITSGPDGNLWFTEHDGNKIGRMTPAGVITEFPLPTAQSYPWRITSGPDGNVWFTESRSNKIGRLTVGH